MKFFLEVAKMTELDRARVLVLIESLTKQKDELEKKLRGERDFNMSAWNMYGSELCAGDMERKEKDLEEEIKEIENRISLLRSFSNEIFEIDTEEEIDTEKELEKELAGINVKLQELRVRKKEIAYRLDKVDQIRKVMGG